MQTVMLFVKRFDHGAVCGPGLENLAAVTRSIIALLSCGMGDVERRSNTQKYQPKCAGVRQYAPSYRACTHSATGTPLHRVRNAQHLETHGRHWGSLTTH